MRRFELVDGSAKKFWSVAVLGSRLVVRFGRIDTIGQTQDKEMGSAAHAERERDKLVREKTRKGYVEVTGASTGAGGTGVADASGGTAASPSAGSAPTMSPRSDAPAGASGAPPEKPPALDTWPASYRDLVFPTRGLKPQAPRLHPWSKLHEASHHTPRYRYHEDLLANDALAAAALAQTKEPGALPHAVEELLFVRATSADHRGGQEATVDHWVRAVGLAYAVERLTAPLTLTTDGKRPPTILPTTPHHEAHGFTTWMRLREHLSSAPDDAYAAALDVADRNFVPELSAGMRGLAAAFPGERFETEIAELRRAKLRAHPRDRPHPSLSLVEAVNSLDAVHSVSTETADAARVHLTLVARHGAAVTGWLRERLAHRFPIVFVEHVARGLAMIGTTEAIIALMSAADVKAIPPILVDAARHAPQAAFQVFVAATKSADSSVARRGRHLLAVLIDDQPGVPTSALSAADHATALEIVRGAAVSLSVAAPDHLPACLREAPPRSPRLPAFFQASALAPVVLRSGAAIGDVATARLAALLASGTLDVAHPSLAQVRAACTAESLGAFSLELFHTWLREGAPSKDGWAFKQLAYLGDDRAARELAKLIRVWPGENQHKRAVTGLDILASIGTDAALMHLYLLSQKGKFKALLERARHKVWEEAERRGLSSEQLGDRLIPDLGLDADGSMTLQLGAKSYRVGFDEHLKPFVLDGAKRIADLPKPPAGDEAAALAAARWKDLKKDAKALASQQLARLEQAMVAQRQWSGEELQQFIVGHPVLVHLARRLLWGTYDAEHQLISGFRVAEDRTFADLRDEAFALAPDARVGVVHPIDLTADVLAVFSGIFAEYKIIQPFAQLGREVFAGDGVASFRDLVVPGAKIMGLFSRGWRHGQIYDAGVITTYERPGGGEISFSPGLAIGGDAASQPAQKIDGVHVGGNRIIVSEVLRDLRPLLP